jgi:multidrug efflux pump subunit AcrB
MERILEATMKRAILVVACILLLLLWGGASAYQMQRDYLPPINNSTLMITVRAQNYKAAQVKETLAGTMEQAVRGVDGLTHIETNAYNGGLFMSLYFPLEFNMEKAEEQVSRAVDSVPLPAGVEKPLISRISTSSFPVMRLILMSRSEKIDEHTLRTTLQERVVNELNRVPGVSEVRVTGGILSLPPTHVNQGQSPILSQTVSRTDGKPSVILDVLKTPSSNITDVTERVKNRLQEIPVLQSGDVQLTVLFDKGEEVKNSLNGLVKEGLLGSLFAMITVFFFFRQIRSTLLIAISLPICLLATTALLKSMGISLNILTISGLIVAMGRVVDDSIVILDNMDRRMDEAGGTGTTGLLVNAVREMIPAVVSSTATTIAVYVPIALIGGMVSSAFSGFAWSVVIALVASLFVSLFVVPTLYHLGWNKIRKKRKVHGKPLPERILQWALQRRRTIFIFTSVLFFFSLVAAVYLPVNLLPTNRTGQISIRVELPEETSLQEVDKEVGNVETLLHKDPNVETFSASFGNGFTPQFDDVFDEGGGWVEENNVAYVAVTVKQNVDVDRFISELRNKLSSLSHTAIYTVTNQNIAGDDSQFKIYLTGADQKTLESAARLVRSKLQLVPGLSVEGAASLQEGEGESVIRERDGRPFSLVTANIITNDVEKVTKQTKSVLEGLSLPAGIQYSFGGTSEQVDQMIFEMAIAFSVSIILVLLIVSAVFKGWKAPLSVFVCIPFALIGSVWGLMMFAGEWNLSAMVGLLMLTGIAVTNGIVLVDKMERNLEQGMALREAVVRGALSRVRPVLITALTTILTLLPLALSHSHDTVISQTLGTVVVGGMISSTGISLLVIPLLYEWMQGPPVRVSSNNSLEAKIKSQVM